MGLITKGMGAILRNRASKKALKTARGTTKLQHPVIKSVKPQPIPGDCIKPLPVKPVAK